MPSFKVHFKREFKRLKLPCKVCLSLSGMIISCCFVCVYIYKTGLARGDMYSEIERPLFDNYSSYSCLYWL